MARDFSDRDRLVVHNAFSSANLAMRQLAQVHRALSLAILKGMQDDSEGALERIIEVTGRLDEAEADLTKMMDRIDEILDAGE